MSKILAEKLFDYLSIAIICIDKNFIICQLNSTTEELFQMSTNMLVGSNIKDLFINSDFLQNSLTHVNTHNQPITEREAQFHLKNLTDLNADYSIKPINDIDGELKYLIEITPLSRHLQIAKNEYAFNQTQAATQLARGMAHEIKNPLGGIRGAAQLLASEVQNDDLKEYTDVIIKEADRLKSLVNNMLGPNKALEKSSANILDILEHVLHIVSTECTKEVKFIRDYDPSIPEINVDKNQLIQAFMNIAKNAVQAIEKQGYVRFKTRILNQHTIGIHKYPSVLNVSIIDSGSGIDVEVAKNLFLPMVTNKQGGTGLGLPISQKIIIDHSGIIQCESSKNETTFNILLPLI